MEPLGQQIEDDSSSKSALECSIKKGLSLYSQNPNSRQVWVQIFKILENNIAVKTPISQQSQKAMNSYLKRSKEIQHPLDDIIVSKKKLICNLYDCLLASELGSVHNTCISGKISQFLLDYYKQSLHVAAKEYQQWRVICLCVEAVAYHICQYLQKLKSSGNACVVKGIRKFCYFLDNETNFFYSNKQMASHVFANQLCLLIGYLDNVKPIIMNYLNIQSLLEVTSKIFDQKECFVVCINTKYNPISRSFYCGGKVKLSKILADNIVGRLAIENTLQQLDGTQLYSKTINCEPDKPALCKKQVNAGWSIITLPQQFQYNIKCVLERLPIFIKPRSNGDILSFQRVHFMPTFSYQLIKPKYMQGPLLTQLTLVIFNVGKLPAQVISFQDPSDKDDTVIDKTIDPFKFENQYLLKNKISYSKVLVTPKSIVVIPANCRYLVGCRQDQQLGLVQLISWNVLPKNKQQIVSFIRATQKKRDTFSSEYFTLPRCLILFDFLNHQLPFFTEDPQIPGIINQFLLLQLGKQQKLLSQALKKCSQPRVSLSLLSQYKKFCENCRSQIINCYAIKKSQIKQLICMHCMTSLYMHETINLETKVKFKTLYSPQDLRYPLNLAKLLNKRKIAALELQNKYQTNICCGKFIGSYQSQLCQGKCNKQSTTNKSQQLKYQRTMSINRFLANKQSEYDIIPAQKSFKILALKICTNQAQTQDIKKQLQQLCVQIHNKQQMKAVLFPKYSSQNHVLAAMCYLQKLGGLV